MREDPVLRGARLVALTGFGRESDAREAEAAGFARHLVKPVGYETLRELFGELVGAGARLTPG